MKVGKIAIIGINGFGGTHVGAAMRLQQEGKFTLQAVCEANYDESLEKIEKLGKVGVRCYRDYRELLKNEKGLDFIVISTPIQLHCGMAVDCMLAGFHVLLEKPPAVTVQDVDAIIAASRRTGRICAVNFMMTSGQALLKLRDCIASGALGEIRTICGKGQWSRLGSYFTRSTWAGKLMLDGQYVLDGAINNPLSHVLNNMLLLASAGGPAKIEAVTAELYHGHEIPSEDTSCVKIETGSGPELYFYATLCSPGEEKLPEILVEGSLGTAKWTYDNSFEISTGSGCTQESFGSEDPFARMYGNLMGVITGEEERLFCSVEDTRNFVLASNGAFESSATVHAILGEYLEKRQCEDSIATDIKNIDVIIDGAMGGKKLFSEMGVPWAVPGKRFSMEGYREFRLFQKSHIGNLYPFLSDYYHSKPRAYSYLSGQWPDVERWKAEARAKALEQLSFSPEAAELDAAVLSTVDRGSYQQEEVEFNTAKGVRVKGTLLVPGGEGSFPAIVALHDHSGFYFYGREKIIEQENEPEALREFKAAGYGGRSWATEAVKRGYVVLCIDGYYFGSRKLDIGTVADTMIAPYRDALAVADPSSAAYVRLYNEICGDFEKYVVKHIFIAGATWPGILFHDDRKCLDYLQTRREVDNDRIGCCGLSLGGLRSAFLAGLEPRIKCAVVAGWMPTFGSLLYDRLRYHTYMLYAPGLSAAMDLPDVVSLTAPNPLLVQQCMRDDLYHMDGMRDACAQIAGVFHAMGQAGRFRSEFYDNGHAFTVPMQEDAFAWLDKWLKPNPAEK